MKTKNEITVNELSSVKDELKELKQKYNEIIKHIE